MAGANHQLWDLVIAKIRVPVVGTRQRIMGLNEGKVFRIEYDVLQQEPSYASVTTKDSNLLYSPQCLF